MNMLKANSGTKSAIEQLRDDENKIFSDLFYRGESVRLPADIRQRYGFEKLVSAGLLSCSAQGYRATVMLSCVGGLVLATDFPDNQDERMVFPIHPESTYFIKNISARKGAKCLDICTGSGIYALILAKQGYQVTAVDLNPEALKYAKFNQELNGIGKIRFLRGNLFTPVRGERFDYISCNPPFEPVPPGPSPVSGPPAPQAGIIFIHTADQMGLSFLTSSYGP